MFAPGAIACAVSTSSETSSAHALLSSWPVPLLVRRRGLGRRRALQRELAERRHAGRAGHALLAAHRRQAERLVEDVQVVRHRVAAVGVDDRDRAAAAVVAAGVQRPQVVRAADRLRREAAPAEPRRTAPASAASQTARPACSRSPADAAPAAADLTPRDRRRTSAPATSQTAPTSASASAGPHRTRPTRICSSSVSGNAAVRPILSPTAPGGQAGRTPRLAQGRPRLAPAALTGGDAQAPAACHPAPPHMPGSDDARTGSQAASPPAGDAIIASHRPTDVPDRQVER